MPCWRACCSLQNPIANVHRHRCCRSTIFAPSGRSIGPGEMERSLRPAPSESRGRATAQPGTVCSTTPPTKGPGPFSSGRFTRFRELGKWCK